MLTKDLAIHDADFTGYPSCLIEDPEHIGSFGDRVVVYDAVGIRLVSLPITPGKPLELVGS